MSKRSLFRAIAVLNVGLAFLPILENSRIRERASFLSAEANAAEARRFRLEEATIADVHRAIRTKQLTSTKLVNLYLKRIKAYSGTCVQGAVDPATGLQLGDIAPIPNAGQINAFITLNLKEDKRIALGFPDRMKRTHTTPAQLPVSMEFVGRPFAEEKLFEIASAYERFTHHRRSPKSFGPLPGEQ